MKKLLLSISLTLIAATTFGQMMWNLDFDNAAYLDRVVIDTVSNPNNIWQIGNPDKTIFIGALSFTNAIVTDTINPYPINDTSSFTIIHIADMGWQYTYPNIYIDGWYFVNSDTLTDYGYIEFSPDNGNTWYSADDIMNHGCCFAGPEELPTFTGNSSTWKHFHYCLCASIPVNYGDTVLYRFTFISDNIQTNKDGLMFDDLHFEDMIEGIEEIQNDNLIDVYPNPTRDLLYINRKTKRQKESVKIFNYTGQLLFEDENFKEKTIDTKKLNLTNGFYFLRYSDTKNYVMKKFIVQH